MSKKVETPAVKARKTKLSNKSVEELIQIILRKDEVERKQQAVIKSLTLDIEQYKEDAQLGNEFKDKYNAAINCLDNAKADMDGTLDRLDDVTNQLQAYKSKAELWKYIAVGSIICAVVAVIIGFWRIL